MPTDPGRPGAAGAPAAADLEQAYRQCERLAREHYENFPIASRLLPQGSRRALTAVYAFARQADDFVDEGFGPGGPTREERLAALADWERRLDAACTSAAGERGAVVDANERMGVPAGEMADDGTMGEGAHRARGEADRAHTEGSRAGEHPAGETARGPARLGSPSADAIFIALADSIARFDLPPSAFHDLIDAFRQDVTVTEYATRADLLDYCRRSADPVGRIVLAIHGLRAEPYLDWSNAICTGLQLANFWQDVGIDLAKGRVYLPREDRERLGVTMEDLGRAAADPPLKGLILEEADWTRSFFVRGKPLLLAAPAALRLHLRVVWHGGMRVLEKIEEAGGDSLARCPKLGRRDWARVLIRAALPVSVS